MKSWVLLFLAIGLSAQTEQAPPAASKIGRVIGEVTAKEPSSLSLTVKADNGTVYTVELKDKTLYLRVPPGEKDLKKAARITLADVNVGDRVLARGPVSEEQKTVPAISVIVMTKEDLAKKHEADREEWEKLGMAGSVTSLNADTKEIGIRMKTPEGMKPVTVVTTPNTFIRRYSPDSAKIADAQPSSFAALQVGDQLRLLGTKSEDGAKVTAEEIVAGTFRTIAGTVISADAAAGTIKIKDLQTQQPVVVKINADSMLRRMPPQMAAMIARRQNAAPGDQGGPGGGGRPPGAVPGGGGPGGGGPGAGGPGGSGRQGRSMDLQAMLGRMPPLTLAELKPGDALLISGAGGTDRSSVTALALIAGVEPMLTAPQKAGRPLDLGGWSFDAGGGAGTQ